MKISRTRSFKINLGNYESLEFSATVSLSDTDLYDEDELLVANPEDVYATLHGECVGYLDRALADDLRTYEPLSDPKSMLHTLIDPTPPRRTERTRKTR